MGYSPYTNTIKEYVKRNPGCCKYDVAAYCTRNPRRNPSKQYYLVNTAIRNGHIRAERSGGKYKLFVDPEFVDPEFVDPEFVDPEFLTAMRVKLTELMNV